MTLLRCQEELPMTALAATHSSRFPGRLILVLFLVVACNHPVAAQPKPDEAGETLKKLRQELEKTRQDAATQAYYNRIASAEREWHDGNPAEANRQLDE